MEVTRLLMGMPITVKVAGPAVPSALFDKVFAYFAYVDQTFSTYKAQSEVSRINRGEISLEQASEDVQTIFELAEQTRQDTEGYFDIRHNGGYDPLGLVKGWAIFNAAELVRQEGYAHFYVEAGGDIQAVGKNEQGQSWRVGIRNPFNMQEIVKVLALSNVGIATSGTYIRGQHIYNPKDAGDPLTEIVSLTVVGPDVYEADRFATAAFAMGRKGIYFIEKLAEFEGYMIDRNGQATFTSGFGRYLAYD
jgi:thiamine biosynthesis lipoprotein